MITGGSQQLLYMTLEALCDEGDIVLVEDPTYFVFLSILQSRGLRARGVRLERDGLDLAHLETVLQSAEKIRRTPPRQGALPRQLFSKPDRRHDQLREKMRHPEIAEKIRARGRTSDLPARRRRVSRIAICQGRRTCQSALMVPGAADRVIYTGTYSKPYAPGARVGFGILPEPLFTAVQRIKGNHDFGTANLLQQLLAGALESGLYDQHVAKVAKALRAQGARDEAGARGTFSARRGNLGTRRRTLFLGAPAEERFHRLKSKVFSDRAEKRRALCARRTLLRRRPGAAQTGPRNAHQLRQRERGKHPRRHQAAGQGVEEICLTEATPELTVVLNHLALLESQQLQSRIPSIVFALTIRLTCCKHSSDFVNVPSYTDRQSKRDT